MTETYKIGLDFSDETLMNAVIAMLECSEYELSLDVKSTEYVITDKVSDGYSGCRTLFIGRGTEASKPYLRVPFDRTALKNAVKELVSDKKTDKHGVLRISKKNGTVIFDGRKIKLTEKELALLTLLYENKGKTVTDREIATKVWNNEVLPDSNITAVYIKYLRAKLDENVGRRLIYRVRGNGYTLKLGEEN